MRYLALAALLLLSGCYYAPYYGYPYPAYRPYAYGPPPAYPAPYPGTPLPPGAASSYSGAPQLQYGIPGPLDPQNCGTPDEPKGCGRQG